MNKHVFRLGLAVLIATMTSLVSVAQSKYKGPVYEVKIEGIESTVDIKILVTSLRNSQDVDYCRTTYEEHTLILQTKEAMSYDEIDALIGEAGFSLTGDVVTAKGVRLHSNGEVSQPD